MSSIVRFLTKPRNPLDWSRHALWAHQKRKYFRLVFGFVAICFVAIGCYCYAMMRLPSAVVLKADNSDRFKMDGKSILFLGDSYTSGYGVELHERWPMQVSYRLANKGVPIRQPMIVATEGWMTVDLMDAINKREVPADFDVVCLMIGVNDQYKGRTSSDFRRQIKIVLDKAIELARGDANHVLVFGIPDWTCTPAARFENKKLMQKQLAAFHDVLLDETQARELDFVDIRRLSREIGWNPKPLLIEDELHPSALTYAHWADAFVERIEELLKR
jgi:acyl-CoA thioesterase I